MSSAIHDEPAPLPKFSLALGGAKGAKTSKLQSRKRPRAILEDESRVPEVDERQEIQSFGQSTTAPSPTQAVIRSVRDADWTDTRKRQKGALPAPARLGAGDDNGPLVLKGLEKGGLSFLKQSSKDVEEEADALTHSGALSSATKKKTIDDEALDALTGARKPAAWTIPVAAQDEGDAFNSQDPLVEDFNATPIEGYGTALLRGYLKQGRTLEDHGYDENAPTKEVKRRSAAVGLGAKESGIPEIELGAWGKAARRGGGEGYMPLAMKSQKTGEVLTQDELQAKLDKQNELDRLVDERRPEARRLRDGPDRAERSHRHEDRHSARDRHEKDYDKGRQRDRSKDRRRAEDDGHRSRHLRHRSRDCSDEDDRSARRRREHGSRHRECDEGGEGKDDGRRHHRSSRR